MSRRVRLAAIVGAALTLLASPVPSAFARQQPPAAQPSGQAGDQPVAPAELQRLFDSYALVQAKINDCGIHDEKTFAAGLFDVLDTRDQDAGVAGNESARFHQHAQAERLQQR